MTEALHSENINEDKLQELRLKYIALHNIIDATDHFFRYPIGMILATELLRVCEHIYTLISLPLCPKVNALFIAKNLLPP